METIREILENNGFEVTKSDYGFELNQYTPAGEDWHITFENLNEFKSYIEDYDPNDDFSFLYESKINGFSGVPEVPQLWEDQLWKKELLDKILGEIQ